MKHAVLATMAKATHVKLSISAKTEILELSLLPPHLTPWQLCQMNWQMTLAHRPITLRWPLMTMIKFNPSTQCGLDPVSPMINAKMASFAILVPRNVSVTL